ncbi:MAG: glycogen debranching enzyme GlgX, partial [Alphaproteobacteria bacterium]|nr:glycogen debranching enzyme GlgX [Alphaproteobacteria bacterium]
YNERHNEANLESNADGHPHNLSWNCGVEGPTEDPTILRLRRQQRRNFLATLLLSQGVPMLQGGDEMGRSQGGNNNAYCQDNEISWVDWNIDANGEALIRFVQRLTALRRQYPVLRRNRFLTAEWNEALGLKDSTWLDPTGREMTPEQWQSPAARCLGLLLDGRAQTSGIRRRGSDATLLLILNAHHDVVEFRLPEVTGGRDWLRLVDTALPEEDDPEDPVRLAFDHVYQVTGRSLLLFLLRPTRSRAPTR